MGKGWKMVQLQELTNLCRLCMLPRKKMNRCMSEVKSMPSNYCLISMTCIAYKMMEHIITSHIMIHAEKHNILCHQQHGFRRRRSCETQLIGYVDLITEEIMRGHQEDTIVLDFSKAFDKVSHTLLIHKLRRYGIRGRTSAWIENFLTDRKQAALVEGQRSSYIPIDSGVP